MKIINIVPDLNKNGGIQNFARSITKGLSINTKVELINWDFKPSFLMGIVLRRFPLLIIQSFYNKYCHEISNRYIDQSKNELIHFWHIDPSIYFLDKKYVLTCHALEILTDNIKGHKKFYFGIAIKNAAAITVDSNYTRGLIQRTFPGFDNKIKVITPAIDFKKINSYTKYKKTNNKIVIGTLSRFVKRKNIPNIIKALNIVKMKHKRDFVFYLAGDGPERKIILDELSKVEFEWKYFGEVTDEYKFKKFYPVIDIFVMPPLNLKNDMEGFGLVYLEANSYGIPVVASKTGGVPDAVKEGVSGLFTDPNDIEDISNSIINLINNYDDYYESSIKWAERFDIGRVSDEFNDIYKKIDNINS